MTSTARVGVVLVAYNSGEAIRACLRSLADQQVELEVVVVDNGDPDGLACWMGKAFPDATYVRSTENLGFGGAVNVGLSRMDSEYVLILNPDTVVTPGALRALLDCAETHPNAFLTPKLVRPDGTINARGVEMHVTGITTCRSLGSPAAAFRGCEPVPMLSGAAILARMEHLRALGGFDPDYFMYLEDADLSLRARLAGFDLICVDDAEVVHDYALRLEPRKFYLLERNRLLLLFQLVDRTHLVRLLPALLATELATWLYAFLKGWRYVSARASGYRWLWSHRGDIRRKRRALAGSERLASDLVLHGVTRRLPLEQLFGASGFSKALAAASGVLYSVLAFSIAGDRLHG